MAQPGKRTLLPASFTRGAEVYAVDLMIYRAYLTRGYLAERTLMCLAEPGARGHTEHVP
jgi:hypothetical protein